jgi:tRNA dimethylallyltransferase
VRIIILGPTASGKTELSILLAEELNTSIVSADSRQCFKHMNIGTAKPSSEELSRAPHFNISNLELNEDDSAIRFLERAEDWESGVLANSEHIIYAGGSTLHLTGLIQPFDSTPDANEKNIALLNECIEKEGIEALYHQLKEVDPEYVTKIDGMNRQRIIRALDVWMQTGRPFSSFHGNKDINPDEHTLVFGIRRERQHLYDRINARVDQMVADGLMEEVQHILSMGYAKDLQALQTVGYREVISYLEGEITLEEMIDKIKIHTRRYAKRQLTWFRRWDFIHWLDADTQTSQELKQQVLRKIQGS